MPGFSRYAIYFLPEPGDPLAIFGARWLGWDVETGMPRALTGPTDLANRQGTIVGTPSKYGFHGTLKPPFRTAASQGEIQADARSIAAGIAPFELPPLAVTAIGRFVALIPQQGCPALAELAFEFVRGLDKYRLPATPLELERRRAAGLGPQQETMLATWGYPYVGPEFRFHLTLSGRLDEDDITAVQFALQTETAPLCGPRLVNSVGFCGELAEGPHQGRFMLIDRIPLSG